MQDKKIKNLENLLKTIDSYYEYLKDNGMIFNSLGFPILDKSMFLDIEPDIIVPFQNRNNKIVIDKKKTVITFFQKDKDIYNRLANVFNDIDEYKKYLGVIESDVTITRDMDIEWQNLILLLNQLFMAILAINGIKVILNTRSGLNDTLYVFNSIPKNIMCASGFLGCSKNDLKYDYSYIQKIMFLLPSKLLIYGKQDRYINTLLDNLGIEYKYYLDFHRLSKKEVNYGRL